MVKVICLILFVGALFLLKEALKPINKISSLGVFGFEDGIFTIVSGSGAIPTVMTFSKVNDGNYNLMEYKEPQDGSYYGKSIMDML